ncbi:MAG: DsbA family protein [Acidobacteria bacterium]|nr:DsbA family protein [Acidobacteriota bacterium]
MRLLVFGLMLSTLLLAQTPPAAPSKKSFLDKPTMEAYVRHLFVWPSQISVAVSDPKPSGVEGLLAVTVTGSMGSASQAASFYVSRNGEKVIQGASFDVKENPFKTNIDRLKTTFAPGTGTPGAPVVVVVFSDFQCPHCREEAKMIRANLTQTFSKEVRAYFKDFPLEQIHDWAKPAAIAGRCVYREDQAKFWDFHDWAFENQEQMTLAVFRSKFEGFLADRKIAAAPVLQCFDKKATEADVDSSFAEGRALEVTSTPTMFVNGRKLAGNLSWPQLKQIIEFEIEYQKTAKNAGENCGCELTLPSVLPK